MPQIIPDPSDETPDGNRNPKIAREQVVENLEEIAERTKAELEAAGVRFPVFFLIPTSGDALITVGTTHDPDDLEWEVASQIALSVMQDVLATRKLRSNSIACALAYPVNNTSEEDHEAV